MRLLHKLVLMFMLGWLPLSGAIAAMMPISGAPGGSVRQISAMLSGDIESVDTTAPNVVSSMPCHKNNGDKETSGSTPAGTCSHCVLCH
ncbi:MAG: hypothetical protein ABL931_23825, partial [Usitatibacteraceae bacterium]